jgi:putative transcriptional regulator
MMSLATIRKGALLVAMPTLLDPNFRQTVVLICEHGPEGSMGLILNRPTTVKLSTILPDVELWRGRESAIDEQVYMGGPVQTDALMILYRGPVPASPAGGRRGEQPDPAAHPVLGDIHLTGDLQCLEEVDSFPGAEPRIRFYLGYAGWAAGQLEAELKAGGWKMLPGDPELVFQTEPLHVWPAIVKTFGGEWAVYADMPPDPSQN